MCEFNNPRVDNRGFLIYTSPKYTGYRVTTRGDNLLYVERKMNDSSWYVLGIRWSFSAVCELLDQLTLEDYAGMYGNEFSLMEG